MNIYIVTNKAVFGVPPHPQLGVGVDKENQGSATSLER